jgi:hypothetical protein
MRLRCGDRVRAIGPDFHVSQLAGLDVPLVSKLVEKGRRAVDRVRRKVDRESDMSGRTIGNLILMTLICVVIFVVFMAFRPARSEETYGKTQTYTDRSGHFTGSAGSSIDRALNFGRGAMMTYQLPCTDCGAPTPTKRPKPRRCDPCAKAEALGYSRWHYRTFRDEMLEYHRNHYRKNRKRILAKRAARRRRGRLWLAAGEEAADHRVFGQ